MPRLCGPGEQRRHLSPPPALPVGCLDGDLVHTGFMVFAPASLPAPEPLAQIQASFFWVWFPSSAPDTHQNSAAHPPGQFRSVHTCVPVGAVGEPPASCLFEMIIAASGIGQSLLASRVGARHCPPHPGGAPEDLRPFVNECGKRFTFLSI